MPVMSMLHKNKNRYYETGTDLDRQVLFDGNNGNFMEMCKTQLSWSLESQSKR